MARATPKYAFARHLSQRVRRDTISVAAGPGRAANHATLPMCGISRTKALVQRSPKAAASSLGTQRPDAAAEPRAEAARGKRTVVARQFRQQVGLGNLIAEQLVRLALRIRRELANRASRSPSRNAIAALRRARRLTDEVLQPPRQVRDREAAVRRRLEVRDAAARWRRRSSSARRQASAPAPPSALFQIACSARTPSAARL